MRRAWLVALMLAVVLGSQWMIARTQSDVRVEHETLAGSPTLHFRAVGEPQGAVLVVHGFAGSKEMMQYWGYALARQGFDAYLLDQPGHGEQEGPLAEWHRLSGNALGENLRQAVIELIEEGRAEPGKVALVGHSMGGAAVLSAALAEPAVGATVAISPAHREQFPADRPVNLLVLVAERDPDSIRGMAGSLTPAQGRQVMTIAGRNHLTILYDYGVMEVAAEWLHQSLGTSARGPVEPRFPAGWIAAALAGGLGAVLAAASMLRPAAGRGGRQQVRLGFATTLAAVAVALLTAVLAVVYVRLPYMSIAVLDYLVPYFLVAGVVLLLMRLLWPREFAAPLVQGNEGPVGALLRGLAVALVFLGAVAPVIHLNLTGHLPNWPRVLPMTLAFLVFLGYFAQEEALKRVVGAQSSTWAGLALGLVTKLLVVATWLGAVVLPNPPVFLNLTLPVTVPLLVVLEVIGLALARMRFSSLSIAMFHAVVLAWVTGATFPLT